MRADLAVGADSVANIGEGKDDLEKRMRKF